MSLNYCRLAEKLVNGGFSVSSQGIEPTSGFVVSIRGFEEKTALRGQELVDTIANYHFRHENVLNTLQSVGFQAYLGGWRNGGEFVLDISVGVATLVEALAIGRKNGQKAVYDVENGVSIDIPQDILGILNNPVSDFRGHPVF